MIQKMRTFICSIVFLDLVGFSKNTVDRQIILKENLNCFIAKVITDFPENEYIKIDCGDGAAIGFVGDPEYALFFAMNLRDTIVKNASDMVARIGINLGPVKLVKDINGNPNLIGDGINVAQRIMSFAEPNQVTVSRSFHEVTSCLSKDIADLYFYIGSRTDKNVRKYQVYSIGNPNPGFNLSSTPKDGGASDICAGVAVEPSGDTQESSQSTTVSGFDVFGFLSNNWEKNKRLYSLCAIGLLVAVSYAMIPVKGKAPSMEQGSTKENKVVILGQQSSARKLVKVEKSFASVRFKVSPRGVIYVDGHKKGVAPAIKELQVEKGEHTIVRLLAVSNG
ncbi:MAG: hypothetical protein EG828_03935 [Deltaproteobacteria bacterium]|nr:hypothetical protein [Deltaproteobacteria bacterium]